MNAKQKITEFINFLERRLIHTKEEHNRIKLITRIEQLKNELSQL